MHVGGLKLVMQFKSEREVNSLCLNLEVWVALFYSDQEVLSIGTLSTRIEHHSVLATLKYELPTLAPVLLWTFKIWLLTSPPLAIPLWTLMRLCLYLTTTTCPLKGAIPWPPKANYPIEHQENTVKEWVADSSITVLHISGKCNPSNFLTQKIRNSANFWHLWDSFMCPVSDFLCGIYVSLHTSSRPIDALHPSPTNINIAQHAQ